MLSESFIEVEYFCPTCNIPFCVYHNNGGRNKHCCYCNSEVKETGVTRKIEGEDYVTYQNGKEIARSKCNRKLKE